MLSLLSTSSQHHLRQRSVGCLIGCRRNITSAQKRALQRKQNNNKSDAATSNQPPSSNNVGLKNIPKAPHMQSQVFESTAAGKKNGVMDTIKAKPLVFAIFVFPTVMMGVALIIRPDFRAQILGGDNNDDDMKKRSNASITVPKDAPAPVYEETNNDVINDVDDSKEEEEEGASQPSSTPADTNLQQNDSIPVEVKTGEVKDLIYALGIRPHPSP